MKLMKPSALLVASLCAAACTSQSATLTNDSGQVVECKNQGWGWIGTPVAMANQSDCLKKAEAAGYHEVAAQTVPTVATKPDTNASGLNIALPAGWQPAALSDVQKHAGVVLLARNTTTDSYVSLSSISREGITDDDVYVSSRRANQESRLRSASHTDIVPVTVNGRPAKRFQVTGTGPDGTQLSFSYTTIFGTREIVVVNTWTTAANFETQRAPLEALSERVAGIQ